MKSFATLGAVMVLSPLLAGAANLATYTVTAQSPGATYLATGAIQAVRQGTVGAQVTARVIAVLVKNGEQVRAGQPLIRLDAGDAGDATVASAAAASAAAARLTSVRADYERSQRLRAQDFISVAAMQRAEAALRSAQADADAADAQARAARTRAAWHTVTAPYSGHVTDLWVSAGDLATPGRPLVGLYDPSALRLIVQVPESMATSLQVKSPALLELGAGAPIALGTWRVIPAIDPATHSVEVRAELPSGTPVEPGQFVRVRLPLRAATAQIRVPASAVLRRSEVTAVYVIDANNQARLRQIRLGSAFGDAVTVLSGLQGGERIALDPTAAGRQ